MIEELYEVPFFVRRHREGLLGQHVDALAESLGARGYAANTIRSVLSGALTFGEWLRKRGHAVADIDDSLADHFVRQARCSSAWRKTLRASVDHVLSFMRAQGMIAGRLPPHARPPLVVEFREWMLEHRGVTRSTVANYETVVCDLLQVVRCDVARLTARQLRAFVVERAGMHGHKWASNVVTASRGFVRFLVATGRCDETLVGAIPSVASWTETSVPRHLAPADVERVVAACDLATPGGIRDHAILLLLSRLGLRAGDVVALTLDAFDWKNARLRVAGKGRREDWLPLPQDVGDAVIAYIKKARPRVRSEAVFFTLRAPISPISRWVVSMLAGECHSSCGRDRALSRRARPPSLCRREDAALGRQPRGDRRPPTARVNRDDVPLRQGRSRSPT